MDELELASLLFGKEEEAETTGEGFSYEMFYATALTDSKDGLVTIQIDSAAFSEDDEDESEYQEVYLNDDEEDEDETEDEYEEEEEAEDDGIDENWDSDEEEAAGE